jgi:hypothetical protein
MVMSARQSAHMLAVQHEADLACAVPVPSEEGTTTFRKNGAPRVYGDKRGLGRSASARWHGRRRHGWYGRLETLPVGTPEEVVESLLVPIEDAAVLAIFGGQSVLAIRWTCRARAAFRRLLGGRGTRVRSAVVPRRLWFYLYGSAHFISATPAIFWQIGAQPQQLAMAPSLQPHSGPHLDSVLVRHKLPTAPTTPDPQR